MRWTEAEAARWYAEQPWLLGANYLPANAINQLELWQAETFSPDVLDRELGWAADLGMNSLRVFLHDLPWQQDAAGFVERVDRFLSIAGNHGIRPMLVLFDSCWDPAPRLGAQRAPRPGVHNSAWVQSPAVAALADPGEYDRLEEYVKGIVGAFADDPRVLLWDLWNEPAQDNRTNYPGQEPDTKHEWVLALLPRVFDWARYARPTQPLTAGLWTGDWSRDEAMTTLSRLQAALSDVLSFHCYAGPADFAARVTELHRFGRPLICTEYMARNTGCTFEAIVPIGLEQHVALYNWGLVAGRSQTWLPWDSWQHPYVDHEPGIWFHDVLRPDGTPYRAGEAECLRAARRRA